MKGWLHIALGIGLLASLLLAWDFPGYSKAAILQQGAGKEVPIPGYRIPSAIISVLPAGVGSVVGGVYLLGRPLSRRRLVSMLVFLGGCCSAVLALRCFTVLECAGAAPFYVFLAGLVLVFLPFWKTARERYAEMTRDQT